MFRTKGYEDFYIWRDGASNDEKVGRLFSIQQTFHHPTANQWHTSFFDFFRLFTLLLVPQLNPWAKGSRKQSSLSLFKKSITKN